MKFKKSVDYSETGGAPLLGINGVCIIAHGSSSPKAVKNAIRQATDMIEKNLNEHIRDDIEANLEDQHLWSRKGTLWNQIKHMAFGAENGEEGNIVEAENSSDSPTADVNGEIVENISETEDPVENQAESSEPNPPKE